MAVIRGKGNQKFPRIYNATDFGITADKALQPSVWNNFGSKTVPAQQLITFGATDIINGGATGRPIFLQLVDSSVANIEGKIRFDLADANETNSVTVLEERTENLRPSTVGDRQVAVLIQEFASLYASEDSKLLLRIYLDSASALTLDYNATNTKILIPVTVIQ